MIRYVDSSEVCLSVRSLGLQNYAGGDEDEDEEMAEDEDDDDDELGDESVNLPW